MSKVKSEVNMPKYLKDKCHAAIHTATAAATAGGAIPIPVADTIPISAAQISMIVALGKIFDITISDSVAKAVAGVTLAQTVGRHIFTNILKGIPVIGQTLGAVIGAVTAATVTETLGWIVADDFYRIYSGQNPQNIGEALKDLDDFRKFLKL